MALLLDSRVACCVVLRCVSAAACLPPEEKKGRLRAFRPLHAAACPRSSFA